MHHWKKGKGKKQEGKNERKEREEQISNVEADDGAETRYGFFGPLKRRSDPNAFNEGGMVPDQMNEGGMVAGRGDMDTVPSMLTPGELVIPFSANFYFQFYFS